MVLNAPPAVVGRRPVGLRAFAIAPACKRQSRTPNRSSHPCEATGRVATMARLHVKVRNGTQMFGRGSIERKCVRLWCRIHERTKPRSMPASVAQLPTLLKCAPQATLEARRWLWWVCRWGFVPAQTLRFFDGHKCIPVNETQWQARSLLGDEPSTVRPWAERRICGVRCRISGMRAQHRRVLRAPRGAQW